MTRSSGQAVVEYSLVVQCGNEVQDDVFCAYEGWTDVWEDPELGFGGWTCPTCGFKHEFDVDVVGEDVYDHDDIDWD